MSENESSIENTESEQVDQNVESIEASDEIKDIDPSKVQSMIRKLQMKVDGEEFEEDYDLSNLEQLKKDIQLARAAKKRMGEAQDQKRKAFEIIQQFESDPASVLKRLGPKGYELAEQLLLEKMQNEMMTPEQRQFNEMKTRLEQYERQEKEFNENKTKQEQSEVENRYAQEYQKTIISALDKTGLPKTPEMAKRMAYLLRQNLQLGLDLDADDLADEMKKEALAYVSSLSKESSAESLINLLGADAIKKLRKHDVEQFKKKQLGGSQTKPIYQSSNVPRGKTRQYQTPEEWHQEIAEKIRSEK